MEEEDYAGGLASGGGGGEEEFSLPKATIAKVIQDLLPSNITCAKETKDLLADCCVEFIHLLTSEASDRCERESRKTMNSEHLLGALEALGFGDFVTPITAVYEEQLRADKELKRKRQQRPDNGMTQEELLQAQEDMFARARAKYEAAQQVQTAAGDAVGVRNVDVAPNVDGMGEGCAQGTEARPEPTEPRE